MATLNALFACAAILTLASCGNSNPIDTNAPPSCSAGSAVIEVQDGFFRNLCGCSETAGTLAAPGATFTCTVTAGTVVMFHFMGSSLSHQILSQGSPLFVSSPISSPENRTETPSHAVTFTHSGTYSFSDTFNAAMSGKIVVQ